MFLNGLYNYSLHNLKQRYKLIWKFEEKWDNGTHLIIQVGRPWPVSLVMTLEDFSGRSQLCIHFLCKQMQSPKQKPIG